MQNSKIASQTFVSQAVSCVTSNAFSSPNGNGGRRTVLLYTLLAALLTQVQPVLAQTGQLVGQRHTGIDSSEGYWWLNTQASTHTTTVQFFGPAHQLLYEESLPGKWVNLSRRNQKRFDQLLAQLVSKQLLTARIKTEVLPSFPDEPAPSLAPKPVSPAAYYAPRTLSYQIQAYLGSAGKLFLAVDNPERLRYKVAVINHRDQTVYEEFTNHNRYRRKLDLSGLDGTLYQVVVKIGNKPVVYQISRRATSSTYLLQDLSAEKRQVLATPKSTEQPLLIPVTIEL